MARFLKTIHRWALAAVLAVGPVAAFAQPPKPAYADNPTTGAIAKATAAQKFGTGDLSGDCTTSSTLATICLKTNGVSFGTFATQNAPTGSTQCLQANSSGVVSGTGSACGTGASGAVTLVSTQTVSAVASVTFPISTGFDYEIVAAGFNMPSGGPTNIIVQCGTGAGPTWDTGNNYFWVHFAGQTDTGSGVSAMNIVTSLTSARTDNFNFATKGLNAVTNPLALFEGFFTFSLHGTVALYVQSATVTGLRIMRSDGGNFGGTFYLYSIAR